MAVHRILFRMELRHGTLAQRAGTLYLQARVLTKELLSAMSPELSTTLRDIDDSYTELLNISQRENYKQGFRDALRFIAEI